MADAVVPVTLNIGLDTVTPPLMAKEGSLIECINYELTDTIGYRRIDGYEAYDGFPNGDITEYFRLGFTATDPLQQNLIQPGTVIYRSDFGENPVPVGVIMGGPFDTIFYDISPLRTADSFTVIEEYLVQTDGQSFIQLQSADGVLRILGEGNELGSTFTGYTSEGTEIDLSISGTLRPGGILVSPEEYLDNLRSYSADLRALVNPAPASVAGLYWFNDRLLVAVNSMKITLVVASTDPQPVVGVMYRWNGTVYRVLRVQQTESGSNNAYAIEMAAISTSTVVDDNLVEVDAVGTEGTVWATDVSLNNDPNDTNSETAYLGYFNNHDLRPGREFVSLPIATSFSYDAGTHSSALGPPITFAEDDTYYAVGGDGAVLEVRLNYVVQESGTFGDGTSVGRAQVTVVDVISGTRNTLADNDVIHSEYPTTAESAVLTVNGTGTASFLAGTAALDRNQSRYQWASANFYARVEGNAAYGVTGAGFAFWANEYGYGTMPTGVAEELDIPKYISFHAGSLALGFGRGSVILSVPGEPANFNGTDGAAEIATGDTITGLLEMPGDTLAVFGLRSIRKITGTPPALGTISGSSGCFNYTAVLVGQDAIFTGLNGISTLQQTAAYGDFAGMRLSDSISNWLRPKLSTGFENLQRGGTVLAYPVRAKNQYRLVLSSGEVVALAITADGPKITILNYGLIGETKIPYAWSSNTDSQGKERIHVTWDARTKGSQVYELESGWGFNGQTFRHYFDTTYLFNNNGSMFSGIEKVRLFGQGYGVATLNVRSSGIEQDFEQAYHERIQDLSIPRFLISLKNRMQPVTNIVDQSNWGLGIKLRFEGTTAEGTTLTEPTHICQALVLHVRTEGALDG